MAAAAQRYFGGYNMILSFILAALYLPLYVIFKLMGNYMK